jgi:hypothetical protein
MKITEEYQALGWEVLNVTNLASKVNGSIQYSVFLKRAK